MLNENELWLDSSEVEIVQEEEVRDEELKHVEEREEEMVDEVEGFRTLHFDGKEISKGCPTKRCLRGERNQPSKTVLYEMKEEPGIVKVKLCESGSGKPDEARGKVEVKVQRGSIHSSLSPLPYPSFDRDPS